MRRFALLASLLLLTACNDTTIGTRNSAPSVQLLAPTDGYAQLAEQPLILRGEITDTGSAWSELEVRWTSSLDGLLYEGPPGDDGITEVTVDAPTPGEHTITLRGSDPAGLTATEEVTITIEQDLAPTCLVSVPTDGSTVPGEGALLLQGLVDDDVTARTALGILWSSDVDGDLGTDSASADGVASLSVNLSPATHEIMLRVTDEQGQTCIESSTVTLNSRPSDPQIDLQPDPVRTADDLVATVTSESVDPEAEAVTYSYTWREGGQPRDDLTGDTVPASELDKGEEWAVDVQASDPLGATSGTVSASIVVANTPPTPPTVEVSPPDPTQELDLACSVTVDSDDADGDGVNYDYAWSLNGSPTSLTGPSLSFLETAPSDVWTCVVTPHDDVEAGAVGQGSVTVQEGCTAFEGDGVSTQAVVPDDPALRLGSGSWTVEAWVRIDSIADEAALISKRGAGSDNGWHLGVTAVGVPYFQVGIGANPRVDATDVIQAGQWTHVAVARDSGTGLATIFLDGEPSGSGALPAPNASATPDLFFGDDGAGLANRVLDGLLDEVRISSTVRYSLAFVPGTSLAADASTVGLWRFEAGSGSSARDASGNGFDAAFAAAWGMQSACDLNLAPSAPVVSVSPALPDDGEPLTCALSQASLDPEGNAVSYAGTWLVDGNPSGFTFTTFPDSLPTGTTGEGEQWTCSAVANDGARDSAPGVDTAWTGGEPICELVVGDPSSPSSTTCGFTAPVDGLVRLTMSNLDASLDGTFVVDGGTLGQTWLFTGMRDWAYGGDTVIGWATTDAEFNLGPGDGPVSLSVRYEPGAGSANVGPDSLTVEFVYYEQLSTAGATNITSHSVPNAQASNPNHANAAANGVTITSGERLLMHVTSCGSAGLGGHGLYANDNGQPNDDGIIKLQTGEPDTCGKPLRSYSVVPGTYDLYLAHEDDFWSDNSGDRAITLYRYTP